MGFVWGVWRGFLGVGEGFGGTLQNGGGLLYPVFIFYIQYFIPNIFYIRLKKSLSA